MFDFNWCSERIMIIVQGQWREIGSNNFMIFPLIVLISFMNKLCPFDVISLRIISKKKKEKKKNDFNFGSSNWKCSALHRNSLYEMRCASENTYKLEQNDTSIISSITVFRSRGLVVENSFAVKKKKIKSFINKNPRKLITQLVRCMRSNEEFSTKWNMAIFRI